MSETFTPFTWADDEVGGTPITAAQLNRLETGVESLDDRAAALELGVLTPVTLTYAASLTVNATLGALFRVDATGNLTITDITGGASGQAIALEVAASGGVRNLTIAGATVAIPAGQVWTGTLRYRSSTDTWLLAGGSESSGGGTGEVSSVNGRTGIVTGLAEASDLTSGLAGKADTSHTHGVTDLTATGTRDASTFLRGDNTWAVPAGGGGGSSTVTQNLQTGTAYTLALSDGGGIVEMNNAAANTVTVPPTGTVAFPTGWFTTVRQWGAGQTAVAPGSGVTINAYGGGLRLAGRFAEATLTHRGSNVWHFGGETAV